jgi:hypothetical protein
MTTIDTTGRTKGDADAEQLRAAVTAVIDGAQPSRTVTVTLGIDISGFTESMEGAAISMQRIGHAATSVGTHMGGYPTRRPTYTDTLAFVRRLWDRNEIRAISAAELAAARRHLDRHVDDVYADLGLVRDPHLIRGEH